MPFTTNPRDGARIYYETAGSGVPVVLLHGFTQTGAAWRRNGFVEGLQDGYRLLLPDARGHGRSDTPLTPEAHGGPEALGADVLAVLDAEGIDSAHIVGYSMGAHTGYVVGSSAPSRARSLVLGGGAAPTRAIAERLIAVFRMGPEALAAMFSQEVGLQPDRRDELLSLDMRAMEAVTVATMDGDVPDDRLRDIVAPCLLFVGERDDLARDYVVHIADVIPDARLRIHPGLDHLQAFPQAERDLPMITEFLEEVDAGRA